MNIHKFRLLNVARALRETRGPFDMGNVVKPECGTPSCAAGHYFARTDLQDAFEVKYVRLHKQYIPVHRGSESFVPFDGEEVREHFGITELEQKELFCGGSGCGRAKQPKAAAEYIERFCERKWPERNASFDGFLARALEPVTLDETCSAQQGKA